MDFNGAINKIMPDVRNGSTEPLIIYRDTSGSWHCDYTQNQYGEVYDWVEDIKAQDPRALVFSGKDFAGGSYPYVHDKVLSARLNAEYRVILSASCNADELLAFTDFLDSHIGGLSQKAVDYLTTLERPLAALIEMCPFDMRTDREGRNYSEGLAADAIDSIENAVRGRLHVHVDKATSETKKPTLQEKLDSAKQKAAMTEAAKKDSRSDKPKNRGRE